MQLFVLTLFTCLTGSYPFVAVLPSLDPEVYMNISQIIQYYNYPCENHDVITEDGYILSMQRIPHGRIQRSSTKSRPVALLQHGLLDSAHTWVINMPNQSLAYILADIGFDVWLTNSRGTTYSKRHRHLSPKSNEFWDFSFDEMAKYDLPACIRYALNITKSEKLSYIGHSQGSLIGFAQFSRDKDTANLVSSFVGLGPVTTVKHIANIPRFSLKTITDLAPILKFFTHGEFFPNSAFEKFIADVICTKTVLSVICSDPIFWMAGFDISNLNKSRLPIIIGHTPAGTSIKNALHYNQLVNNGQFQMYDYGSAAKNQFRYGTKTPPKYNVTNVNVPLAIFWGGKDTLADPEDVEALIPTIHNTLKYNKYVPYYNHMDYVWGIDAHQVVYKEAITFIRSYL